MGPKPTHFTTHSLVMILLKLIVLGWDNEVILGTLNFMSVVKYLIYVCL